MVGVRRFAVLAACLAAIVSGPTSPSRAAVAGTPLPFGTGTPWLAVDPVGQHVFVSGGSGNSSIAVLDFAGNLVKTITGESGASGMVINRANHTLYVALQSAGQIAEIDTTTLTETTRFSTGSDTDPYDLVIAAGKLWVNGNDTMSVNLDGTGLTKATVGGILMAASRDGNLLAFADSGYSPVSASVYDVATIPPRRVSRVRAPNNGANGLDIAFDASGQNVLLVSGAPYFVQSLDTRTLSPSGRYTTGAYPNAATTSPNGAYVAGGRYSDKPDVFIFRTGDATVILRWSTPRGLGLSTHGLAFSPDGAKLFVVAGSKFFVLSNPAGPDTPVSVTSAPPTATLETSASLGFSSPDTSVTFRCSRDGAPSQACTSPVHYSALAVGLHTFQVQAMKSGVVVGSAGRTWLVENLDSPESLTVVKSGTGSGGVTSAPAGINCGATCVHPYNYGTSVHLYATPATGSSFVGWTGGGCSGTGSCIVSMTHARAVTASFALPVTLTVSKSGRGSGSVSSSPLGISCGSACSHAYRYGTLVTLTASAGAGSVFTGWSGACAGMSKTCHVSMTAARAATATFAVAELLVVTKAGRAADRSRAVLPVSRAGSHARALSPPGRS